MKNKSVNFDDAPKELNDADKQQAISSLLEKADNSEKGRTAWLNEWCKEHQLNYKTLDKYINPERYSGKTISRKQRIRIEAEISQTFDSVTCRAIKPNSPVGGDHLLTRALSCDGLIVEYIVIEDSNQKTNLINIKKGIERLHELYKINKELKDISHDALKKIDKNIEFINLCEGLISMCSNESLYIHVGHIPKFMFDKDLTKDVATIAIVVFSGIPPSRDGNNPADLYALPDFKKLKKQ